MKIQFSRGFFPEKITEISNFMKIRPVEAEFLHADRRKNSHDDVVSSFLCHTHTDGKDKLLEWPDRSCLLLYVSARIH